ncbi:MAG TPA: LysR substrate-binding domain-containing protein [Stenotrophomonas sp.]|nr:LysR substrate-binding domain-containing protein [Stenotrophomonas sp.]
MHFDLTDLRLFVAVADAGSITAGAAACALSLAAASARLRQLEDQAGITLLERGRRGVQLTPAGRALLRHARQIGGEVARLRGELAEYAGGQRATIRLLANTAALSEWLPERIADFLVTHPALDVALVERGSIDAADAVREAAADLAVIADHASRRDLQGEVVGEDVLVLVCAHQHRLAQAPSVRLPDLFNEALLGLSADSALQRHLISRAAEAGGRLQWRAHVPALEVLCRMVARGAGVAIVPRSAARRSTASARLASVPLQEPWAHRTLWLVAREFAALPLPLRQLADWLRAPSAGA